MPWFRVDDAFHSHPKVLATSLAARGLWATAGSWSSAHLTDGVLRDREVAALGGTPELAAELVTAGLWERRRGGYQFHDWLSRNPSKEAVENGRKSDAERQRRRRDRVSSRRDSAVSNGVSPAAPARSPFRTTPGGRGSATTAPPGKTKPPWCGICDKDTRQTGPADQPYRCPNCHPMNASTT